MSKLFEFGAGWVVASFLLFAAFMIVAVIVAAIYAWVKGGKAADGGLPGLPVAWLLTVDR